MTNFIGQSHKKTKSLKMLKLDTDMNSFQDSIDDFGGLTGRDANSHTPGRPWRQELCEGDCKSACH